MACLKSHKSERIYRWDCLVQNCLSDNFEQDAHILTTRAVMDFFVSAFRIDYFF
jgi:hypothetical protein